MKLFLKKSILITLLAALATLGVASLPIFSVSAAGLDDPKPALGQISNEKLEMIWARQLKMYDRIGKTDDFVTKVQRLIDKAAANGKDISTVQAALDAFSEAAKDAKPIYVSMNGIVNAHQGFDANGKVTDPDKAKETVRAIGEKFKEIKTVMNGTGKALHEAIKAFREANPRPEKTK